MMSIRRMSGEPARMLDLKPLLTGSVPAHNVEAEHAVDDGAGHELTPLASDALAENFGAEDFGADAFEAEAPDVPEIVRQQESLIERVAAVARKVEARPVPKPKKEKAPRALRAREKAAFTLRLDAERHLRLRLASAVTNRSSQVILTDLLDEYLSTLPEIDAMASRLPAARPTRQTMPR